MLEPYTKEQDWLVRAFSAGGTSCSIHCGQCGRIYFVTAPGHGDYEPGELEDLRSKAAEFPQQYIEVPDFRSVEWMSFGGKSFVVGCHCGYDKKVSAFLHDMKEPLTAYLKLYWEDKLREAQAQEAEAKEVLTQLGD